MTQFCIVWPSAWTLLLGMAAVATDMGVSGGVGGGAIDVDAGGKGCRCLTGGRARCLHRWVVDVVNHITYVLVYGRLKQPETSKKSSKHS